MPATQARLPFEPNSKAIAPVVRKVRASTLYDAASQSRRTIGWHAPTSSPNSILQILGTVRDRSREAIRNDPYAKRMRDRSVSTRIGTGIKPHSQAVDPKIRDELQKCWRRIASEIDADGLLDFYGLQSLIAGEIFEAGETFVRLRRRSPNDGLLIPLQLQVLEPELCPYTHNGYAKNGNIIRAGIEFNAIGRRVAYWFHPSRPVAFNDFDAGRLVRLDADDVIHLYHPLRAGQLRGLPALTASLVGLHELSKFGDATLLRQQLGNMFVAFVRKPQSLGVGESLDPLTGETIDTFDGDRVLSLEPGIFQELAPGEEIQFSDPPEIRSGYADFMRQGLLGVSAGVGMPYESVSGDYKGVNDRLVRVPLNDEYRSIQAWQYNIMAVMFCDRIWTKAVELLWSSGIIPMPDYLDDPLKYAAVMWTPQRREYLHPVQDIQAKQMEIRNGFTSRSAVASEQGEDSEEIDREQAQDNARADELGLKYDCDGRNGKASGNAVPPGDEEELKLKEPEEDSEEESEQDDEES